MKKPYQHFKKSSFLSAENLSYLEHHHASYPDLNNNENNPVILKEDVVKSFKLQAPTSINVENNINGSI